MGKYGEPAAPRRRPATSSMITSKPWPPGWRQGAEAIGQPSRGTASKTIDAVLKVFVDVLQHPEFREDKIPLAKGQINTAIARRNDQPSSIATRQAQKLGYGA